MPEPKPVREPAALDEFMAALRALRQRAGGPSFRRMAAKSGAVSHATLHLTVTGHRLQPWETVREFVRACDGDESEWHARWQQTYQALSAQESRAETPVGHAGEVPRDAGDEPEPARADPAPGTDPVPSAAIATDPTDADVVDPGTVGATVVEGGPRRPWWRSRWLVVPLVIGVVSGIVLVTSMLLTPDDTRPETKPGAPVHPGDASSFVKDVTIPDETVVKPDTQFVKVWEIKNSGSVPWRNRYLQRIDRPDSEKDCVTPERIPINNTAPLEHVQVAVTVRTPKIAPAYCKAHWKMVDESGRQMLPAYRPVYFEVYVRR